MPELDWVALGDLKPLDMPAHQSLRSDLGALSDSELLASVQQPSNQDWVVVNTKTGYLYDGNGRVYELLRRIRPGSEISLTSLIPVEYYSPDYSMFPDMEPPRP